MDKNIVLTHEYNLKYYDKGRDGKKRFILLIILTVSLLLPMIIFIYDYSYENIIWLLIEKINLLIGIFLIYYSIHIYKIQKKWRWIDSRSINYIYNEFKSKNNFVIIDASKSKNNDYYSLYIKEYFNGHMNDKNSIRKKTFFSLKLLLWLTDPLFIPGAIVFFISFAFQVICMNFNNLTILGEIISFINFCGFIMVFIAWYRKVL